MTGGARSLPLLVQLLREPARMAQLTLAEWDLALRQALATHLTPTLYCLAEEAGVLEQVPPAPRRHLEWTVPLARRHRHAVNWEASRLAAALERSGTPLILLKGAAYTAAGLAAGRGRLFSDIDLLVPRAGIGEVESALMRAGWSGQQHDPYDQRYYRVWMHEIPPMRHTQRGSVIDVHHTILPLTARARPDADKLRAAARPVPGNAALRVLAPPDMVLHSATHLFYDGEFDKGLRDLFDLHQLLGEFGGDSAFWDALVPRAHEMALARPLFYALRYCPRIFGTAVPAQVTEQLASSGPRGLQLALMDALFGRALRPLHASCATRLEPAARFALYVRGNWLRMPPLMLARHLFHKAFISPRRPAH